MQTQTQTNKPLIIFACSSLSKSLGKGVVVDFELGHLQIEFTFNKNKRLHVKSLQT